MLIRAEPRELWRARCVYVPTAEEDVVRPHHGQGEQLVELRQLEVVDVPQDELPPGLPVLLALPVTSVRLHLVGQGSVLLDKVVHVQGRHLAFSPAESTKATSFFCEARLGSRFWGPRVLNSATQRRSREQQLTWNTPCTEATHWLMLRVLLIKDKTCYVIILPHLYWRNITYHTISGALITKWSWKNSPKRILFYFYLFGSLVPFTWIKDFGCTIVF